YSAQWKRCLVSDVQKMQSEATIRNAALVLIVFNESEEILAKDLETFERLLLSNQVMLGPREVRSEPISDRIGHRFCSIALWPVCQGPSRACGPRWMRGHAGEAEPQPARSGASLLLPAATERLFKDGEHESVLLVSGCTLARHQLRQSEEPDRMSRN